MNTLESGLHRIIVNNLWSSDDAGLMASRLREYQCIGCRCTALLERNHVPSRSFHGANFVLLEKIAWDYFDFLISRVSRGQPQSPKYIP